MAMGQWQATGRPKRQIFTLASQTWPRFIQVTRVNTRNGFATDNSAMSIVLDIIIIIIIIIII